MIPKIKTHYIADENPENHWCFLPVDNEVVLDLGCSKHLVEDNWLTTPEYFWEKGAISVTGVDPHEEDIKWYQQEAEGNFIVDYIDSPQKVSYYVDSFNVTSMKMDIEWKEEHFVNCTSDFPTLKYVAIETHSRDLFHDVLFKLLDLGFQPTHLCHFYPRVAKICNVIFASRGL